MSTETTANEANEESGPDDSAEQPPRVRRRPRWFRGLSTVQLATVVGLVTVVTLASLCGWLGYRTYQEVQAERFRLLLIQTGRQGAVNLTTINYEQAEADVRRILDSATGQFYDEFNSRSAPFIDVVKKAQSKTEGTVTEAGVESVSGRQEGQVLVAVSVTTTNRGAAEEQPRYWRMRMTITRQGDGAKVSKVDFVP